MRQEQGVSLLETMVVVAIVAVLVVTGIPSIVDLIRDTKRDSSVLNMVSSLNYARSEAIRRGCRVTVCPSMYGRDCNGDVRWETGWIVFTDPNANGRVDLGELILRVNASAVGETIRGSKHRITYQGSGFSLGFMDTLRVCDSRGLAQARSIVVNMPGRVMVGRGATACP